MIQSTIQKGLSTICFKQLPLNAESIRLLVENGIQVIELSDYHPGFSYEPQYIAMIDRLFRDNNIKVSTIHSHIEEHMKPVTLSAVEKKLSQQTIDSYKKVLDSLEMLNGDILITHDINIPGPDEKEHLKIKESFIQNVKPIAEHASERNLKIALENTIVNYTRRADYHLSLLEEINLPKVGACLDTGHANLNQDVSRFLETLGEWLLTLHIHDNQGETDNHFIPGLGMIDWKSVIQALKKIKYSGLFMYEVDSEKILQEWKNNLDDLLKDT